MPSLFRAVRAHGDQPGLVDALESYKVNIDNARASAQPIQFASRFVLELHGVPLSMKQVTVCELFSVYYPSPTL